MNKPITINQLLKLCKEQVMKGNGDKCIMISNDDEGNGYHYLWYAFCDGKEMLEDDMFSMCVDERVAKIEDTIVLG